MDVAGDVDGVDAFLRGRSVAAFAMYPDRELVHGSHDRARRSDHGAGGDGGGNDAADVGPEDRVHVLQTAFGDGPYRSGSIFLFGLEEETHGAFQLRRVLLQYFRRAEKHGHVGVVAAGMHPAGIFRGEGEAGGLLHRQGVHVGAEGKDLSRARAADLGSESVVRPVLCEGNSEFPELFFHIGPGSRQASSGLRDAVQIPSVFCDGVLEFTAVFPHGFTPLRSFSFEDFLQRKDDQGNADHLGDTGD